MDGTEEIYQCTDDLKKTDYGFDPRDVYQVDDLKTNDGIDQIRHVQWVIIKSENDEVCGSDESIESGRGDLGCDSEESSSSSSFSSSSSDMVEDATSSSSNSSYGPLYELSELMNQLPIKRGLSKYYQGKSQSFTSLANVKSLEDLPKKVIPYNQRMKSCKSYAGFDGHKFGPKATITKKSSRGSFLSSLSSRGKFMG